MKSTAQQRSLNRPGTLPHRRQHPPHIRHLLYLCGIFVVLPFFDIPFIGLSVTAPLLLPLMYYAFFQPAAPWIHQCRSWIMTALAIWLGMVASFIAHGPWFEMRNLQTIEIAYLVRYLFWLMVFLVTAYVASDLRIQRTLPYVLGSAVVMLAGLRSFEGIVLGKVGAWSETNFTMQNSYGILFSSFTPFLFPVFLGRGFFSKLLCAVGLFTVLFACAINGSRGSWICIALAFAAFLLLTLISRPQRSLRLILPVGFAALALVAILAGSSRAREAVISRFSTFEDIEKDKSYMTRRVLNQKSVKLFEKFPWFGVGPGRYQEVYVPLDLPQVLAHKSEDVFMRKSSHNSYLSYLAEGGIAGSLPLAVLLAILAMRGAMAAMTLNLKGERWALGVYASFIAMSVHFWALSGLTGTHAWFVYGLVAATICLASQARKQGPTLTAGAPLPQRTLSFRPRRPALVGSR